MFLRKILRKIKLKVYDQKSLFSDASEKFTLLFSILTLSLITINFGFDKLLISKLNISLILISSIFYCLIFFFKSILYINIISFLKNNIVQTLIILFILLDLTKTLFHDFSFYNQKYKYLIFLFINLYFTPVLSQIAIPELSKFKRSPYSLIHPIFLAGLPTIKA